MNAIEVQRCFQSWFEEWGMPQSMRFDNGNPWAYPQSRMPTSLTLWLVGLGVRCQFGRPRQSTDNAVVERSHGVLTHWVEPHKCGDCQELQQQLNKFIHIQRAVYPGCDGISRLATYPDLHTVQRPYERMKDAVSWQQERILAYVASTRYTRTVEKCGRITHFTHQYSLGRAYAAQQHHLSQC